MMSEEYRKFNGINRSNSNYSYNDSSHQYVTKAQDYSPQIVDKNKKEVSAEQRPLYILDTRY